jgi:hypothetical protein
MSDTETLIRAALHRGGLFNELTLDPLANTGNNRVFRMEAPEGTFIVKQYFQHPDDPRDRFAAERAFYSYLWDAGIRSTPEPVQWLLEDRLAVFQFLFGEKPGVAEPPLVAAALDFFREMNASRHSPAAAALPQASEACFSLREHLDCIERRVTRLGGISADSDVDYAAADFAKSKILPAWSEVKKRVEQAPYPSGIDSTLSIEARCVSPSDFGFHNSIISASGRLRFFDFEYSGWDDPAKTICDFFCQPAVPVDHSEFEAFLSALLEIFPNSALDARAKMLLPVYQIKWCCIILNEFLPTSAARRRFAHSGADETKRKAGQLARAEKLLAAIPPG